MTTATRKDMDRVTIERSGNMIYITAKAPAGSPSYWQFNIRNRTNEQIEAAIDRAYETDEIGELLKVARPTADEIIAQR